jgi:hypothetical protein
MLKEVRILAILFFVILLVSTVYAGDYLALQGNVDESGISLSSGDVRVAIYDSFVGGNLIYNSSNDFDGAISQGKYDILLGNGSQELNLNYGQKYYIEFYVDGGSGEEQFSFSEGVRQVFQASVGNVSLSFIHGADKIVLNNQSVVFAENQNVSTSSGGWFKGLFNWTSLTSWLSFDGATLSFNEGLLNDTIDSRVSNFNETDYINSNFIRNTSQGDLNVNNSVWWAGLTGWVSGWFSNVGNELTFNETKFDELVGQEINTINTTVNIQNLGFYNKTQIDENLSLYLLLSDDRFNDTDYVDSALLNYYNQSEVNSNINSNVSAINQNIINNYSAIQTNFSNYYTKLQVDDNLSLYLLVSDQRFNETALINSINQSANIMSLGFYDESEIDSIVSALRSDINSNLTDAKSYANTNILGNLTTAQTYTNTVLSGNVSAIQEYINTNILGNLTGVETYTNTVLSGNVSEMNQNIINNYSAIQTNFSNYYNKLQVDDNLSLRALLLGGNSFSDVQTFDGDFGDGGVRISNGSIFAQQLYVYNISALDVDHLSVNGSAIPTLGFDDSFDLGSSDLRWRNLFISQNIYSNGSIFGDNIYSGGNLVATKVYVDNSISANLSDSKTYANTNILGNLTTAQTYTNTVLSGNVSLSNLQGILNSSGIYSTYNSTYELWAYNQTTPSNTYTDNVIASVNTTTNIQNLLNSTGIYSTYNSTYDGMNSSQWITSGSNIYYDAGKVGIGTDSPDNSLVVNISSVGGGITIDSSGTSPSLSPSLKLSDQRGYSNYIGLAGNSGHFATGATIGDLVIANYNATDIHFTTNNTIRATIDSSGKVGIGTISPTHALTVQGSSSLLNLSRTSTGALPAFILTGTTGGSGRTLAQVYSTDNFDDRLLWLFSGNSGAANVSISSSGKVGIGTSSPSKPLHIVSSGTNDGEFMFGQSSLNDEAIFRMSNGNNFGLIINSNGNSPYIGNYDGSTLSIVGWNSTNGETGSATKTYAQFAGATNTVNFNPSGIDMDFIVEGVGQANALFVQGSDGNVAIGTDSPSDYGGVTPKLTVEGSSWTGLAIKSNGSGTDPQLYLSDNESNYWLTLLDNSDSDKYQLRYNGNTRLTVDTSGNVGIGTSTPTSPLHVRADGETATYSYFQNLNGNSTAHHGNFIYSLKGDAYTLYRVDNGSGSSKYWTAGVDQTDNTYNIFDNVGVGLGRLTIQNVTGNVGIGIKAPLSKLHVNGTDSNQLLLAVGSANIGDNQSIDFRYGAGVVTAKNARIRVQTQSGGGGDIHFETASSGGSGAYAPQVVIKKDGKFGIGTTSPNYLVSLGSTIGDKLAIYDAGASTIYGFGIASGELYVKSNNVKVASFMSTGKVGIGTSTPTGKLEVNGGSTATDLTLLNVSGTLTDTEYGGVIYGVKAFVNATASPSAVYGGYFEAYNALNDYGDEFVAVKAISDYGIGVQGISTANTGVYATSTSGSGLFASSSTGYAGYFSGGKGVGITSNFTVDTNTLHVDSNTNSIGIRKTNPTYTLDIVGNISASTGIWGYASGNTTNTGVSGISSGSGTTNFGVYGAASGGTTNFGIYGTSNGYGVQGIGNLFGVHGQGVNYGVYGNATNYGVFGVGGVYGIRGEEATEGAYGYLGYYNVGVDYGGYFQNGTSNGYAIFAEGPILAREYQSSDGSKGITGLYGMTDENWDVCYMEFKNGLLVSTDCTET